MNDETIGGKFLTAGSLVLWVVVIFLPLLVLFVQAVSPTAELETTNGIFTSVFRSFGLSVAVAAAAVLLGWVPGRLLGTCRTRKDLLLFLLLMPLVLPRYVLYYAWTLMLSPTTTLGAYLSGKPELARFVGTFTSSYPLVLAFGRLIDRSGMAKHRSTNPGLRISRRERFWDIQEDYAAAAWASFAAGLQRMFCSVAV